MLSLQSMMSMKTETLAVGSVVGVAVVLLIVFLAAYTTEGDRPVITTAHVVNLDRDTTKLAAFQKQRPPLQVERWTATYGKDLKPQTLPALGIGNLTVCAGKGSYGDQWKELRNQGAIGCYVSHRALLQHCATLAVPDTAGHFILEDDALFAADFSQKWESVRHKIPTDWDIVYLGMTSPKGHSIGNGVTKLYTVRDSSGNWGLHGYLVRHGALRSKILPNLRFMFEAIDGQLNAHFDEWNCYSIEPYLVTVDKTLTSTIQTM